MKWFLCFEDRLCLAVCPDLGSEALEKTRMDNRCLKALVVWKPIGFRPFNALVHEWFFLA